jgi:hypothetical protein
MIRKWYCSVLHRHSTATRRHPAGVRRMEEARWVFAATGGSAVAIATSVANSKPVFERPVLFIALRADLLAPARAVKSEGSGRCHVVGSSPGALSRAVMMSLLLHATPYELEPAPDTQTLCKCLLPATFAFCNPQANFFAQAKPNIARHRHVRRFCSGLLGIDRRSIFREHLV